MAPSQAGVEHETIWTNMRTILIQQIHKPHLDAFLNFLKDDLKMSDIEDSVLKKSANTSNVATLFWQQKRNLMDYLEERHSKDGIFEFLLDWTKKVKMNLTLDGDSVCLKHHLKRIRGDWKLARNKARREGHLDEGEFVGREEALRKVREMLRRETDMISGVFICGMYGCGKTTLASEAAKKGLNKVFDRCFIDLKGIKTVDELFYKLKRKLGMKTIGGEGVNWSQVMDRLKNYDTNDLLIFFDGVEQLLEPKGQDKDFEANSTCEEMINVLVDIINIPNSRVKLILTSQLDIWADDIHQRYPPTVYEHIKTLRRSLEIYRLANFSHIECQMLIKRVAPEASKEMTTKQFGKIANACGCNALGVQLVANYLRTIKGPVEKVLENITEDSLKFDRGAEKKMTRVFRFIFDSMAENSRKLLIQLSAFDSPFDVKAAMKVTESGASILAMSAALDVLIKRHLLEVYDIRDSQMSGKISIYDFIKHTNIRLSLHTLTQQFTDDICVPGGKYTAIRLEADEKKQEYYRDMICRLGRQVVHDSLTASMTLSEYRGQLKECINQTINDERVLPSFTDRKNFREQYHSHVVMEWFLKPKKRATYYFKKAQLAKQKGDMVSFVGMYSWYADTFFDGASYDAEVVKKVLEEIKMVLGDQVNFPQKSEREDEGRALVRGHYFYVQARYHFKQNEPDDAIVVSRNCVKTFKEFLGYDLALGRALNLAGSAYHSKGDQPKDALRYHRRACDVLEKLSKRYSADIHFDSVMFYQNVGSQYHTIGNKIADEIDMNIMSGDRRENLKTEKLENYKKALKYYDKSIEVIDLLHMTGTWNHALILRNRCTLLSELGEIEQALESAKDAHEIAERFLFKDTFLQIKSNSILATAHCDMAEEAFGKGDIEKYDEQMFKAEECFHEAAKYAIKMGRTAENYRVLEKLMRDYRRHLYSWGKCEEAQKVTKVFETMLEIKGSIDEIPPNLYQRMKKRVTGLFWQETTEALGRPLADDLPTPYEKKFKDREVLGPSETFGRPIHVSWRDRGRRYWWRVMLVFEPLHRIWYRWFQRSQGQGPVQTAAAQKSESSATKRKQDSGSIVQEKRRKIDGSESVDPGHVTVPQDSKLAKVFEENDSDSSSNGSDVTNRRRQRLNVQRLTPVKPEEYDEDAMSMVSDAYSTASTPFYENFDESSRLGEDSSGEADSYSDAESGNGGEEAMNLDLEVGRLAVPETHLAIDDSEPCGTDAKPLPMPYVSYSEDPDEGTGQATVKDAEASSSGYLADVSSMQDKQGDA
ncbi:uncharacterized protein LOC135488371 [Lineus longissimus]|uniref:uncharacterized protein LOC135488371 n=1 Tax=Lineus longissimus TaxID=88925 RepID=UPI00315D4C9B